MRRLLLILALLLVLVPAVILVAVSGTVTMQLAGRAVAFPPAAPTVTPPPGALSVEDLAEACRAQLEALYPDAYSLELDGDDLLVRVVLSPETDALCLEEANRGELSTWYPIADALVEASGEWYRTFAANGHPEIKFNLSYVRREETGERRLCTAVNGYLNYDFYELVAREAARIGG